MSFLLFGQKHTSNLNDAHRRRYIATSCIENFSVMHTPKIHLMHMNRLHHDIFYATQNFGCNLIFMSRVWGFSRKKKLERKIEKLKTT